MTDGVTFVTLSERPLAELEEVIERGLATFLEVGQALLEIRERRLYREQGYASFDAYARERWDMTARHANRLAQASVIVAELGPMGPIPANERVVRVLVEAPAEERREVWAKVVETYGPYANSAQAREAVDRWVSIPAIVRDEEGPEPEPEPEPELVPEVVPEVVPEPGADPPASEMAILRLKESLKEIAFNVDYYLGHDDPAAIWGEMDAEARGLAARVVGWFLEMDPSLGAIEGGEL